MSVVYIDLETWLIERGTSPRPVCVSYAVDDADPVVCRISEAPWGQWSDAFFVGANIAFDLDVLLEHHPELRTLLLTALRAHRVLDVQVAEMLICHSEGDLPGKINVAYLAERYCGWRLNKDTWRLLYGRLDAVPIPYWPEGAVQYSACDASVLRAIAAAQAERAAPRVLDVLGHATFTDWGLAKSSLDGVHADPARAAALVADTTTYLEKLRERLSAVGILRGDGTMNTTEVQRLAEETWRALGREAPRTPAGAVECSADAADGAVDAAALQPDESLRAAAADLVSVAEWRTSSTLRTRAEMFARGGILQPGYRSCMSSYRTSSYMQDSDHAVGPQVQNFPRGGEWLAYLDDGGVRKFSSEKLAKKEAPNARLSHMDLRGVLCPGPGELFFGADIHLAELHALAEVCHALFGFSRLGELLLSGVDVHWHFAARMLGRDREELEAAAKKDPKLKEHRNRAKAFVFSVPGGVGPAKISLMARKGYGVEVPIADAKRFKKMFLDEFPEVSMLMDLVGDRAYPHVQVHPITGYVRGGMGYTDGCNQFFQHLTAFVAKEWTAECQARTFDPNSALYRAKLPIFVHDELIGRCPATQAPAAGDELAAVLTEVSRRYMPTYPCHAEPYVSAVWSKDAATVRDEQGRLVEWRS